jgi:transcriptional regulator
MDRLTATHESRLSPKPIWTRSKMDDSRFEKMIEAVQGFELRISGWRGTAKLGQNKTEAARLNAARAAEASGNRALAHLMRELPNG